jgi:hypothetical protein
LRWGHAVGDEVDDVRHGNPKAADSGSPGQHVWILSNAFECLATVNL